jgi:DNA-binding NtrC family response regulator
MHLVITDLRMPGADGLKVLKYAVRSNPDSAVVILTAFGTLDTALEAIKEGAYDYLTKPFKVLEVIILAERAYKRSQLIKDNRELRKHLRETYQDMELLKTVTGGDSADMTVRWKERVERLKAMNVLTRSETELLKERLVTGNGGRKDINR